MKQINSKIINWIKANNIINIIISNIVRFLLLSIIIQNIYTHYYSSIFVAFATLILTYFPSILEKKFGVYLPATLELFITLFIFASQYLGELNNFYDKFPWWDIMLHTFSGIVLGILGFMFVYLLNEKYKHVRLSPLFVVIFAFSFAITIGVFWEFFEFTMDRLIGTNMQRFRLPNEDGLTDTMTDLIVDAIGAFITSFIGYLYILKKRDILFKNWFKTWFKKNKKK